MQRAYGVSLNATVTPAHVCRPGKRPPRVRRVARSRLSAPKCLYANGNVMERVPSPHARAKKAKRKRYVYNNENNSSGTERLAER